MKLCFYSPYLPHHFGGGEKHLLDVALAAAQQHTVSIAIKNLPQRPDLKKIQHQYEKFYGHSLDKIHFITTPLGTSASFWSKLWWTRKFDGLYYVTDGSLFCSLARRNYLHIQIPFTHSLSLVDRLKFLCWHSVNTNSAFTKSYIEQHWKVTVHMVLHPMVDVERFSLKPKKEKIILNVGRFFKQLHSKRQDVLVQIFKQLVMQTNARGWQLYLVGSVEDKSYFEEVTAAAKDLKVQFITDATRTELEKLYEKASIYWHATGFGVQESIEPAKVEHFGITTVEAMAAQAVPLVVGKGGQKEVLGDLFYELNWQTEAECVAKTAELLTTPTKLTDLQKRVRHQAEQFSKTEFEKKVTALFAV